MKKIDNKRLFFIKNGITVLVVIIFVAILAIGKKYDTDEFYHQDTVPVSEPYIEVAPFDDEQVLVGHAVSEWLMGEKSGEELYNKYSATGRVYSSKSVTINYAVYDIPTNVEVKSQLVELSENSSFENAKEYIMADNKRGVRFDHLFTDRIYYYRISVELSDGSNITESGQFKTADTPRLISVDSVWNMRDIGGVKTLDGKKMRQGLIYRGVELDGAVYEKYCITSAGAEILTEQLGIKTETDLRAPNDNIRDMLGPNVKHTVYNVYAYVESLIPYYSENYRKLFSDLAKEENYPMYVHCTYGKDRTGTVCYLLQLLLGVSEEDAFKEWEISVLLDGKIDYGSMEMYRNAIMELEGDTMQDKAENLLLSFGVTEQEIESIRTILLEDCVSQQP